MNLKFNVLLGEIMPVIRCDGMRLLFDTGASTPVWCQNEDTFIKKFPSAKKMNYKFLLTGFGRNEAELINFLRNFNKKDAASYFVDVYNIPEFILETNEERIVWKNLNVAVTSRRFSGVHMILPSTMFRGMKFIFDQARINPEIIIESLHSTRYMSVELNNRFSPEILQYIYASDKPEQIQVSTMDIF